MCAIDKKNWLHYKKINILAEIYSEPIMILIFWIRYYLRTSNVQKNKIIAFK